ncbi:MAG TPA: hypothetical protein PLY04_12860 [bacterium]|nr:hypothetical protein [bacterium]HPM99203.1 hypothetical protein [bacterium]
MTRDEKKERFIELRIKGETFESIAKELEVSKQTLINWSKEYDVNQTITTAKLMKYQNILKVQELNRDAQIEYYSKLINKCKEELFKRKMSEVATDKLLNLILRASEELKKIVPTYHYRCDVDIMKPSILSQEFHFDPKD